MKFRFAGILFLLLLTSCFPRYERVASNYGNTEFGILMNTGIPSERSIKRNVDLAIKSQEMTTFLRENEFFCTKSICEKYIYEVFRSSSKNYKRDWLIRIDKSTKNISVKQIISDKQ